jgi:hypothetical protein
MRNLEDITIKIHRNFSTTFLINFMKILIVSEISLMFKILKVMVDQTK